MGCRVRALGFIMLQQPHVFLLDTSACFRKLTKACVFQAYKYVPFGKVDEVIPYLIRRAQENSDVLGGVGAEVAMLKQELARRLNPFRH
jgi:Proline dehydrogenase